jgi:hypothetical protein
MRTIVTRGDTQQIKTFDRMVMELCPYLTPIEIDKVVGFMDRIQGSQYDINPTETDSATQLKLILGGDRYAAVKQQWTLDNQHILAGVPEAGTKYLHVATGQLYDGLDETDNPDDYKVVKV